MIAEFVGAAAMIVEYLSTTENLADIFTNTLRPQRFEYKLSMEMCLQRGNSRGVGEGQLSGG